MTLPDTNKTSICINHRLLYGEEFKTITSKQKDCVYSEHSGKKAKNSKLKQVDFPSCEDLLRRDVFLPFGFGVCSFCISKVNEKLGTDAKHNDKVDLRNMKIDENKKLIPMENFDMTLLDLGEGTSEQSQSEGEFYSMCAYLNCFYICLAN